MFGMPADLSPLFIYGILAALGVLVLVLWILTLFLFLENRSFKRRLSAFFSGKQAKDLEQVLAEQLRETKVLDQEIQELFEISNRLRELGLKSFHKSSVLRFNPFKEVGSNQSFCVVFLDGRNCGVAISSLHTREGTRVYAKPIVNGQADGFPLTDEEKAAVAEAIQGKKSPSV